MKAEHVAMPAESRAVVMVVDTRVRHELAAGEYAARRGACERAARGLGVAALRDADAGLLEARGAALAEDERRAARHVVSENARVLRAARALREWDEVTFGQLMFASHDSLRDDFRVSCAELDAVVETARTQEGVLGARLTGGGFGGCVVMLVRPGAVAGVRGAIEAAYRARFGRECGAFLVRASGGAAGRAV
jgi:galactokinase